MPLPVRKSRPDNGPWSARRILNQTSPVASADIHALLVACVSAWHNPDSDNDSPLAESEKRSLIDRMPPPYRKYDLDPAGRLMCPLSIELVLDDCHVKAASQIFKQDLQDGYYQTQWQKKATVAMQERRRGRFDSFLLEQAEETFGEQGIGPNHEIQDRKETDELQSGDSDWNGSGSTDLTNVKGGPGRRSDRHTQLSQGSSLPQLRAGRVNDDVAEAEL